MWGCGRFGGERRSELGWAGWAKRSLEKDSDCSDDDRIKELKKASFVSIVIASLISYDLEFPSGRLSYLDVFEDGLELRIHLLHFERKLEALLVLVRVLS